MAYSEFQITAPVGIEDVRRCIYVVLRRTVSGTTQSVYSSSIGVLIGSEVGDTVPAKDGNGDWTVVDRAAINPLAKYKPVRVNKFGKVTDAEFMSVDYGLFMPSAFAANNPSPNATWIYDKPRLNTDIFRLSDFDGYDHKAASPFAFDLSGELGNSIGIWFFINSAVNAVNPDGRHWQNDTCLSVRELLLSKGYGDAYVGFCIHDIDEPVGGSVAVVTNKQLASMSSTIPHVVLFAETRTVDGKVHPAVPLLGERDRSGHTFRFIAALFSSGPESPISTAYAIMPENMLVHSLAFEIGCDRKDVVLNYFDTIAGLQASMSVGSVSWTYVGRTTRNGAQMDEYSLTCTIYGTFVTPSPWRIENGSVGVDVTVRNPYGYAGDTIYTHRASVHIPDASTTYNNIQICTISGVSVRWFKEVPMSERMVVISAVATYIGESLPFENTVDVSLQ